MGLYLKTGTVMLVRRFEADGVEVLEFAWTADSAGEAVLPGIPIEGLLERLWSKRTRDAGGAATHAVRLYDGMDDNVLLELADAIPDDAAVGTETALYHAIDADRRIRIGVAGLHTLRISGAASDAGLERLYVRPAA